MDPSARLASMNSLGECSSYIALSICNCVLLTLFLHNATPCCRTIVAGRGPGVTSQGLTSDALSKIPTSKPWDGQDGAVRVNIV